MNILTKKILATLTVASLTVSSLFASAYNLEKSTPVGSWQLRRELATSEDGKTVINEIKTSLVGEETRNGKEYVWVETCVDAFKSKKGNKGKQMGEHTVFKILMEKQLLMSGSPEEVFNNLQGLGEEIIMQSGDSEPVKINAGGMMGGAMLQALGTAIDYKFDEKGKETISTPAGKFKCKIVEGAGSAEIKIVFKKIRVESTSKQWMSDQVPFGIVKIETSSETNGDVSTTLGEVIEFGKSGAVSEITGNPESLQMPGLGSLFGG